MLGREIAKGDVVVISISDPDVRMAVWPALGLADVIDAASFGVHLRVRGDKEAQVFTASKRIAIVQQGAKA
jgi:hypothetical protein